MLTDAECRNAICPPEKKRQRFACSGGLYLEVSPGGSKRWFWKYRKDSKEFRIALGSYPDVGPKDARKARDVAKAHKTGGANPVLVRKAEKLKAGNSAGDTFKAMAVEWFALQVPNWSASHATRTNRNLEKDLYPSIGSKAMTDIHPMELLAAIQKVEERGSLEAAKRVLDTAVKFSNIGCLWPRHSTETSRRA